jgi:hypothetical protein
MSENRCGKPALAKAYWPGHDPLPLCPDHQAAMVRVAGAMGLYVRMEQAEDDAICSQFVGKETPCLSPMSPSPLSSFEATGGHSC